ncbi:acyl-CoA dehydrogenase [Humibacter sp.]|uniref:acyl-CoA dehydrogenase n=1 Tax=Humibacter sp. TaxID=1940291 RepID=UPI002CE77FD4|nr:acyl-CoA dehydrogenase [Humibacter sp.]HVX09168.1 acyl-CoA dehydrogenase [Humibacter sp.]
MRLTPSEEQLDLQGGVRDFVRKAWSDQRIRAALDQPFDVEGWVELDALGLFDLDGLGGLATATIVLEELGRALVPGPLVATMLARRLVPGAFMATCLDRTQQPVVEHLDSATHVVVLGERVGVVATSDVQWRPLEPLDPLTPVGFVEGVRAHPTGSAAADPWRLSATLLSAALAVGVAQGALDLATSYAKQRVQFGRPIGSFQAIKHLLADMLARTEVARSAVWWAAATADDPDVGDPRRATSSAALLATDAATANGRAGIQIHGGMGFTWEVLAHLYAKRAWVLRTAFGSPQAHTRIVADSLKESCSVGVSDDPP